MLLKIKKLLFRSFLNIWNLNTITKYNYDGREEIEAMEILRNPENLSGAPDNIFWGVFATFSG